MLESLETRRVLSAVTRATSRTFEEAIRSLTAPPVVAPSAVPSAGTMPLALTADALGAGGIRLNWLPLNLDPSGQIVVFRKALGDDNWPQLAIGEPAYDATSFTDTTAAIGQSYEYRVVVYATLGAAPYEKYIFAGNAAAPVTSRGSVLLVVDASQLDGSRDGTGTTLLPTLQQYSTDLISEGYKVITMTAPRVDLPRTQPTDTSPAGIAAHFGAWSNQVMTLKQRIRAVWQSTPDLKTVVLIGHVAVPYSGTLNPDGSEHVEANGAWASDAFYTTLSTPDSLWTDEVESGAGTGTNVNLPGDGKFDQDSLAELGLDTEYENKVFADVAIGRIDFSQLFFHKGVGVDAAAPATVGETKLLANYFARDHAWRTGQVNVQRKALFEEEFPFAEYYDTNRLTPDVGMDGIVAGTVSPNDPLDSGQINLPFTANAHSLSTNSWLWLYAGAGGYPPKQTIHFSPGRELRADQYVNGAESSTYDLTTVNNYGPHKAVFNLIYGSYVGDWDDQNGLMRSIIAEVDGYGLTATWGARPNLEQHPMGLGEPIGVALQKTVNNFGEKQAYGYGPFNGSVRLFVMGDPTLREANVAPASNVQTVANGNSTTVSWTAPADPSVAGYYLYRATSSAGPFVPVDDTLHTGTSFTDTAAGSGEAYYMVRAARLESVPSGSYWNLADGAFSVPTVTGATFTGTYGAHALEVTFSQDVGTSLAATDLTIGGTRYDSATHTSLPTTLVAGTDYEIASYDPLTRKARIVFHVTSVPATAGQIPSGRFSLKFATGSVTNVFGGAVDAAYQYQFGYLVGDTNGDLRVDFSDLLVVAKRYNTSSGADGSLAGDFNGDGRVNFDDLLLLAKNYNVTV